MKDRPALAIALLFGAMLLWQSSFEGLLGYDGYYHLAQSRRMLAHGPFADMPWMSYSVFDAGWVDHHWLYHLLLAPFMAWPGGVLGGKLSAALLAGGALTITWAWLRSEKVPLPLLWALLPFAVSWGFAFRLGAVRAVPFSIALLIVTVALAARGRPIALAVAVFAWMLGHHEALFSIPVGLGAYVCDRALVGRTVDGPRRVGFAVAVVPIVAVLAGLALHPHAPRTFEFVAGHMLIASKTTWPKGAEWDPLGWRAPWMAGHLLPIALLLIAPFTVRAARAARSLTPTTVLLLLGTVSSTVLAMRYQRFIELSLPLCAASIGFCLRDAGWRPSPRVAAVAIAACLVATGVTCRYAATGEREAYRLQQAGEWLRDNAEPGDVVYNFHWGEWPELVYWAPEFKYIVGLTPAFLADASPEKWAHYDAIYRGDYSNIGAAVAAEFGASWFVAGEPHPPLVRTLEDDPRAELAFRDAHVGIWRIVP